MRVDSGVYEGAEISMFYDPMIAKLVTFGQDRPAAVAAMREALDAFFIRGLGLGASIQPTTAAAYALLDSSQVPRATAALRHSGLSHPNCVG